MMKQGKKRKSIIFASSEPSSSSSSTFAPTSSQALSVSPTRDLNVKKRKSENAKMNITTTLDDILDDITIEHSEGALLPPNLAPITRDSSDEEESEEEVEQPFKNQFAPLPTSKFRRRLSQSIPAAAENNEEYEVEQIILKRNGTNYHLVKWMGYDVNEATWELSWDLDKCKIIDQMFEDRKEICSQIYQSLTDKHQLADKQQYDGFSDTWINGIVTTTLIESLLLEEIFTKFCRQNNFADFLVENWTRSIESFPKFVFLAENIFSSRAKHLLDNTKHRSFSCICENCDKKFCQCLKDPPKPKKTVSEAVCLRECHQSCRCGPKCTGRIYMNGRKIPVMLVKTATCGWSLFTMAPIKKNRFVIEYVGLVKLHEECQNIRDQTYLFDIDSESGKTVFVIDASVYGNASRFINHSCNPNLEVRMIKGLYSRDDYARITFFSIREIKRGEELTFNYFKHEPDLSKVGPTTPKCHCGYDGCRKHLI